MDRWALTLLELLGRPVPPVPALPGRLHLCSDRAGTEQEVADAAAAGDALALGGLLGIPHVQALALVAEQQAPGGPLDSGALTPQYR